MKSVFATNKNCILCAALYFMLVPILTAAETQIVNLGWQPSETLSLRGKTGRMLLVNSGRRFFFYSLNGKPELAGKFQAPQHASLFDIADIDADGMDDLCVYTGAQLECYRQAGPARFVPMQSVKIKSLLPAGSGSLSRIRIFFDLNNDGYADIVFPGVNRYLVYLSRHGEFAAPYHLPVPFDASVSDRFWKNSDLRTGEIKGKLFIPKVLPADLDGDGFLDFYSYYDDLLMLLRNDGNGRLSILRRISLPVSAANSYASAVTMGKIDADAHVDALLTVIRGSGTDIRAHNYFFFGSSLGSLDTKRYITYREDGGFFFPVEANTAAGKVFLQPKIDIGLGFVLSYLVQNRLQIRINQVQADPGSYRILASNVLSYQVAEGLMPGFEGGDFDGDGYDEFAVGITPNLLHIYKAEGGVFSEKPQSVIDCQAYGILRKTDLNGDNRDDLVIVYPYANEKLDYRPSRITLITF